MDFTTPLGESLVNCIMKEAQLESTLGIGDLFTEREVELIILVIDGGDGEITKYFVVVVFIHVLEMRMGKKEENGERAKWM
jgi:hypothetical protein